MFMNNLLSMYCKGHDLVVCFFSTMRNSSPLSGDLYTQPVRGITFSKKKKNSSSFKQTDDNIYL